MDADDQNLIRTDEIEIKDERFFQVDFIKAIMIFLVIYDHTIPWDIKREIGVALWERISIPVFLVIMGINMGLSFSKIEDKKLRNLYSWRYFKRKFWRYIYPFLILLIVSSLIGLAVNGVYALNQYQLKGWHFSHFFIGILPFWGPGNWFIPVILWTILIMPLLYKGFSGKLIWRIISLILCYIIELSLRLTVYYLSNTIRFPSWDAYFAFRYTVEFFSPIFLLSAIGLGMWFSKNPNLFAKQNLFMWIFFPLSLYYLIQFQFFDFQFDFLFGSDYTLFAFPYSAFLVLLGIKLLPKRGKNWFTRAVSTIAKSTYHILLTQILYFAVVYSTYGDHYGASILGINWSYDLTIYLYLIINWVICIPCGVFWYYVDFELRNYYRLHKKNKHRKEES